MARVTIRTSVLSRWFAVTKFLRILGIRWQVSVPFYLNRRKKREGRKGGIGNAVASNIPRYVGKGEGSPLAGYIESRRISLVAPQRLSRQLKGQT